MTRSATAVAAARSGLVFGWIAAGWFASAAAATASSVAPEAAAALAPYAMWVGRQPASDPAGWEERKALAFRRGRFGAWLEADYQVRAMRGTPERHAALCIELTRAARANEDWARAATWFATARESLSRVPEEKRTFALVADFYDEAVALREVTDVRVCYGALARFVDEDAADEAALRFFVRLVDMALVAQDEDNYPKLASSLVTAARAWAREAPGADESPAPADLVLATLLRSLIARGHAASALPLIEAAIAHAELRTTLARAARVALAARGNDAAVQEFLAALPGDAEASLALFGADDEHPGVATWLVRQGRTPLAHNLLASARDLEFAPARGAERETHERNWNAAVLRGARAARRAGRMDDAAALGRLYTEERGAAEAAELERAGVLLNRREGLVAFATWLGAHGAAAEARRLLDSLPIEYPGSGDTAEGPAMYQAMHRGAAEAVRQQKRVALALAHAAAGGIDRATELLDQLPGEDEAGGAYWHGVRRRIRGAIAAAAAAAGNFERATRLIDELRDARTVAQQTSLDDVAALVPPLILVGRHEDAWEDLAALAAADAVIARVIPALVARGRGNHVIEWISAAPEAHRHAAWRAFFAAAAPDPEVLPVRPLE